MKRVDGFLIGMCLAVLLAWLWPAPGAHGGALHPELLNKLGVALIFFLHGLTLSSEALKAGTLRWPLHLLVQLSTFLLFPLLGLLSLALLRGRVEPALATGLFFLCALPSTVSSSVALTALARGNVPAALFNATLSSLLGVFITPFWLAAISGGGADAQALPLGKVILDLIEWLVVPFALGQLLHPKLGAFADRHKPQLQRVDRATILLLIYTSFCDSFQAGIWQGQGLVALSLSAAACALLLAVVMTCTSALARVFRLELPERIVAVFCGSKKTLASGVPMARLMFGHDPGLSLILLPLMIYHPLQLVVCGWFAARWARRADT
ncbi:MAG TPA: bile acid:sodium symporter family protein [Polyangiales bacterium]|nr:bile acid:sodium symporter family protein [Polyangiales bacterium]